MILAMKRKIKQFFLMIIKSISYDYIDHSVANGALTLSLKNSNGEYTLEIIPLLINLA